MTWVFTVDAQLVKLIDLWDELLHEEHKVSTFQVL